MRNTSIKVGLFSCALLFLSTSNVNALSSKYMSLGSYHFSFKAGMETVLTSASESDSNQSEKDGSSDTRKQESKKDSSKNSKKQAKKATQKKRLRHTVTSGETLTKIAQQHKTKWQRIFNKNIQIQDPDLLRVNQVITIPLKNEELPKRTVAVATPAPTNNSPQTTTQSANGTGSADRGSSVGNTYYAGYCTWYAKNRRPDLPNNLGSANTWVARAVAQGISTGSAPRAGAIGQQGMHVVYVERVNGDGTITVSEMNYAGFNVVSSRRVPASNFNYIY